MMASFFLILFFIVIAGIAIGSLLTIRIWYSFPLLLVIVGLVCFSSFTFGVIIGAAFLSWLPLFFTSMMIILLCLSLIVYFYLKFHPSYGYIPFRGWIHWGLLVFFFFFIGLDFAVIGLSAWLLFLLFPFFAFALMLGSLLVWRFRVFRSIGSLVVYLPLLLFFFLALVKLL